MPQSEQRLRTAAVSARQLSQTQVVRSVVVRSLVLVVMALPLRGVLPTVERRCDADVNPRLRFGADEFRSSARSFPV